MVLQMLRQIWKSFVTANRVAENGGENEVCRGTYYKLPPLEINVLIDSDAQSLKWLPEHFQGF